MWVTVAAPPRPSTELLVSGEAVELDIRPARLGSRALALIVDIVVQLVIFLLLLLAAVAVLSMMPGLVDEALGESMLRIALVVVMLGYPTLVETFSKGRSLGKLAVGLRVVREDGGPIQLRHAFTRCLVGAAVEWPGLLLLPVTWVVGLLTMVFSSRGKRLGDLAAGTIVIHERTPAGWGFVQPMPAPLALWATRLDLTGVSDELALAVRHYLARAARFAEPHRSRLGTELATEVAARATPAPPPGTPAWAYLAAVLAERHRRASVRTAGRTQPDALVRAAAPATGWQPIATAPAPSSAPIPPWNPSVPVRPPWEPSVPARPPWDPSLPVQPPWDPRVPR